ncbi:MAG: hypothetical protein EXR51_03160 [Dehalococcoidia bacterium]|nr:hypothetical protein [Dehalococcoidia bacterium]
MTATPGPTEPPGGQPGETIAVAITIGLCLTGAGETLLALAGRFSPLPLLAVMLGAGMVTALVMKGNASLPGWPKRWPALETLILGGTLAALAAWFTPPAEFVLGGLDPGVYLNAGVALARSGSFWLPEPLLAQAGPEARAVFVTQSVGLHSVLHPGFYWDEAVGAATPQFPFLLTVWTGIASLAAGVQGALMVPVAIGVAAAGAGALLGRRLLGPWGGVVTAALLGFHTLELWHARLGLAEELAQAMFLVGLWSGVRWLDTGRRDFGAAAGLALGTLCLVKTESAAVGLIAVVALLLAPGAGGRAKTPLVLGWALSAAVAGTLYATAVRPLVLDQMSSVQPLLALMLALVIAAPALVLIRRFLSMVLASRWSQALRLPMRRWMAVAPLLLVMAALALLETRGGYAGRFARALGNGLYLSPLDGALAVAGLAAVWALRGRPRHRWVAGVLIATSVLYLAIYYRYLGTADRIPLYLWATRRLVPTVLPALALLEAGGMFWLTRQLPRGWARAGVAIVALVLTVRIAGAAVVRQHTEYQGAVAAVDRLAALTEPGSLLLFEPSDTAIRLATPLRYLRDRSAYVGWNPAAAGVHRLIETAAEAGRPVYYLGYQPGPLSSTLTGYASSFVAHWSACLPELERTSAQPPGRWSNFPARLDVYRLESRR